MHHAHRGLTQPVLFFSAQATRRVSSSNRIHPTAVIDPAAQLHGSVSVGPYAVIGPGVRIGAGTSVGAHCVIEGETHIGEDNRIFQFASLGAAPQDKKYAGEPTRLVIGHRNTIREFCTFNTGTVQDRGETTVGDDNWIMAYVHIAHDCVVGHQTILANNATLAGHVHVGDHAIIGGLTGIHQFCRVGAHAMAGFASHVSQDVPPFMMVDGNPLAVRGLNTEGLRRRGFDAERVGALKKAYRALYRQGLTLDGALDALTRQADEAGGQAGSDVHQLRDFVAASRRGIVR
ncbi:acyl-[acyl-carrier-protein]--UDP-N-acetylglucosamine O-acyltransferase [Oryzisolibacter propanilivorax]|uniref:Acyl-[acyl-carrier-protein]--UDP-N-acetylglucosamine O-acyltransferase n=1 Tax=Oryzisolibacter propanilivorax TaxID=1527607 RepID=A0A1G9SPL3_9BURK|nr:acyl-[acyl-carrier-protein]--UDP-N-acetylglucosamine O-acyltransferase [Oryzisolibacter propanilivorax]